MNIRNDTGYFITQLKVKNHILYLLNYPLQLCLNLNTFKINKSAK